MARWWLKNHLNKHMSSLKIFIPWISRTISQNVPELQNKIKSPVIFGRMTTFPKKFTFFSSEFFVKTTVKGSDLSTKARMFQHLQDLGLRHGGLTGETMALDGNVLDVMCWICVEYLFFVAWSKKSLMLFDLMNVRMTLWPWVGNDGMILWNSLLAKWSANVSWFQPDFPGSGFLNAAHEHIHHFFIKTRLVQKFKTSCRNSGRHSQGRFPMVCRIRFGASRCLSVRCELSAAAHKMTAKLWIWIPM